MIFLIDLSTTAAHSGVQKSETALEIWDLRSNLNLEAESLKKNNRIRNTLESTLFLGH